MNEKTKAYLAALSFSAIIGFSFLFTKIALSLCQSSYKLGTSLYNRCSGIGHPSSNKTYQCEFKQKRYSFYSAYESFLSTSLFYFPILCFTVYIVF